MREGVSTSLGLILGVTIAMILVILAVFVVYVITSAVTRQAGGAVAVEGTSIAYYNATSNNVVTKLVFTITNPTARAVNVESVIIKDVEVEVNETVDPENTTKIIVDLTGKTVKVAANDIDRGYIEFIIVTNITTIQSTALLVPTR